VYLYKYCEWLWHDNYSPGLNELTALSWNEPSAQFIGLVVHWLTCCSWLRQLSVISKAMFVLFLCLRLWQVSAKVLCVRAVRPWVRLSVHSEKRYSNIILEPNGRNFLPYFTHYIIQASATTWTDFVLNVESSRSRSKSDVHLGVGVGYHLVSIRKVRRASTFETDKTQHNVMSWAILYYSV